MAARASNFATKAAAETVKSVDQFGEHFIMKLETGEESKLADIFRSFPLPDNVNSCDSLWLPKDRHLDKEKRLRHFHVSERELLQHK